MVSGLIFYCEKWWFWDQLTLFTILWRTLIASPKFPCGNFAFHATCILFLSFLTVISFLTTTSYSTTALGPLLDAPDRCVGFITWRYWVGVRTVRRAIFFPHDVLLLRFYYSRSRLSILKVLWWRRGWRVTFVACLTTADLLLVVPPATCWNPGHLVDKNPSLGGFSSLVRTVIFLWWEVSPICPGAFPEYRIRPILTMNSSRMFLSRPEHHFVLEFPCGLVLEPVI